MKKICLLCLVVWFPFVCGAQAPSPFGVQAEIAEKEGEGVVTVSFRVDPGHFLYADTITVSASAGGTLSPLVIPAAAALDDPFGGGMKKVYEQPFELVYRLDQPVGDQVEVSVAYQGCSHETCFFPENVQIALSLPESLQGGAAAPAADGASGAEASDVSGPDWKTLADRFRQTARATGYMKADAMLTFIREADAGGDDAKTVAVEDSRFEQTGVLTAVFLILLGGLALNFTPCVLPMIPINLAIIGAGAQAGSKQRGFILGLAYGAAIALVYGVLGLVVVLTGATFGALNASPWFNVVIALIFIALALAMFDIFHIDLTRFQNRFGPPGGEKKQGHVWLAFSMGGVAALLAGACVAPVVISVLVWSNNLYSRGDTAGLLLPFVLGVGMALPWPFAGAGMRFLPKPGKWMAWVRSGFGVLILLLATYYAYLAWQQFTAGKTGVDDPALASGQPAAWDETQALTRGFEKALNANLPVIIDFSASWCKNCKTMEKLTFKDKAVIQALQPYVFIMYHAEDPNDPRTKEVLEYYSVLGLPTMVALFPE
ncbi:MAG: DUF255 domain-containing protein [Spartobacteria bacterium]|nr:DUF255 domain-containing protein [Spartobacteria bacterium]